MTIFQKYLGTINTQSKTAFICDYIWGISHGTYYNWINRNNNNDYVDHRTDRENIVPANKLTQNEIKRIELEYQTQNEQNQGRKVNGIVLANKFLDEDGVYVASASTINRYIHLFENKGQSLADKQLNNANTEKKEVCVGTKPYGIAYAPNQIWVADTTYLKTTVMGKYYYLLTIMDLYSRKIVFAEVFNEENAEHWKTCLNKALIKEYISDSSKLQFHTDNGSSYRAQTFQAYLERNHIKYTHNRPLVSNDNAYMESFYSTMKRCDKVFLFPFKDISETRAYVQAFVKYYNTEHLHSGLCYITPENAHSGQGKLIINKRNELRHKAKEAHPERFARYTKLQLQEYVSLTRNNNVLTKEQDYKIYKGFKK